MNNITQLLNSGKGIVTQISKVIDGNEFDGEYYVDLGANEYITQKNTLVYFMRSPNNSEYIMFTIDPEDNNIIHLLFHHTDIDEMVTDELEDLENANIFDISEIKGITHYVDFHEDNPKPKRIKK